MRRLRTASAAAAAALLAACAGGPRPGTPTPVAALDGAWQLKLEGPIRFSTPLEVRTGPRGVEGTVLGPEGTALRVTGGSAEGNRLRLRAGTPRGGMKVDARLVDGRLEGRWAADHPIGRFLFRGRLTGERVPAGRLAPLVPGRPVVDSVAAQVARSFFDPAFAGADLGALTAAARASAAAARTDGEVVEAVRTLLRGIPTSHTAFYAVPVESGAAPRRGGEAPAVVSWRVVSPAVGYVRIAAFASGASAPGALARLDSAFGALGALPALVIDLRGNPGGNLELGSRLADHLVERPLEAGYFVTRAGLESRGVRSIDALDPASLPRLAPGDSVLGAGFHEHLRRRGGAVMLVAGGGRATPYRGRVAVLIDRGSGSTAEAVAAALGESGRATLVGERTAGAMLSSAGFTVAPGWELRLPVADFRTPGRRVVEGKGVEPAVAVPSKDALKRAVQLLTRPAPR
jgi:hypothetical protein